MSAPASDLAAEQPAPVQGRALWLRQVRAILAIDLKRSLWSRRALLLYLFAALPVFVMLVPQLVHATIGEALWDTLGDARTGYSIVFQTLMLRGIVFFGCAAIFSNLFRGEVLQRSLHYYLLSPVRRDVLVFGKYLFGLILTGFVFAVSTLLSFLLLYPGFGLGRALEDLTRGPGGAQLVAYLGVILLACLGYGSVFLLAGIALRNPILPVVLVFGWEAIHFLLPPLLKKFSVIHYVKSLIPLPMSEGPFAVVSDPPSAILSVLGLLVFTGAVLVASSFLMRRFEIDYGDD